VAGKAILHLFDSVGFFASLGRARKRFIALSTLIFKTLLVVFLLCSIFLTLSRYLDRLRFWKIFLDYHKRYTCILREVNLLTEYIKKNSTEHDRIFVWGFAPEFYVLTDRSPASRYIQTNYLTGLIPWVNCDPNIDTAYAIVPGAWEIFMREMNQNRPLFIIDTSIGNYACYAKYPPHKYKYFADFLNENYTVAKVSDERVNLRFRLFKRKK